MEIDIKDKILRDACPTVMAPKYSLLPEIEYGYRYLMASDGLWVETVKPWGHFRVRLWKSPRPLPYGTVDEVKMLEGGRIPANLVRNCVQEALNEARYDREWAGWITWSETFGYEYTPLNALSSSSSHIRFERPWLGDGEHLVLELHSHPFGISTFSAVDDRDDEGGVKFSGIIYFVDMHPRIRTRLCIEGHFFDAGGSDEALS